jgi:hypothetical protein
MFSFLEAPKGAVKSMNDRRERMLGQEIEVNNKYHLVNWPTVTT